MPVAVRLVEVLALVTLLAILTGFSLFIVFAERMLSLAIMLVEPIVALCNLALYNVEQLLLLCLSTVMRATNSVGITADCFGRLF